MGAMFTASRAYWKPRGGCMPYRRQPFGCGTLLLLAFFIALIPASFQTGQWWLGLIVATALVLGAIRAVNQPRRPTHRKPVVRQIVKTPARTVYRARCDHYGAPRKHGADACRYCGRSLVVG
jgi:hypothetical protein